MPTIRSDLPVFVLDSFDHGESDKIVTFFCQGIGRLTAIAKGAHRSKKRFVNKLELFSFLQITYSRSSPTSLAVLNEAELINSFITLRSNLEGYRAASTLREIVLLATGETVRDDNLFQLMLWALHSLDRGEQSKEVLALFLIKLFDYIGYQPDFSCCQQCGTPSERSRSMRFTVETGGLLCNRCTTGHGPPAPYLAPGTTQMIRAIQQQPVARLKRFKPSGTVLEQILESFHRYGLHLFQREIHSWRWL